MQAIRYNYCQTRPPHFISQLFVNVNKIALLRNSRGRNFPDLPAFSARFLDLGAAGITLHPRRDQRHARYVMSIGHALVVECLEMGMDKALGSYLEICQSSATWRDAAA